MALTLLPTKPQFSWEERSIYLWEGGGGCSTLGIFTCYFFYLGCSPEPSAFLLLADSFHFRFYLKPSFLPGGVSDPTDHLGTSWWGNQQYPALFLLPSPFSSISCFLTAFSTRLQAMWQQGAFCLIHYYRFHIEKKTDKYVLTKWSIINFWGRVKRVLIALGISRRKVMTLGDQERRLHSIELGLGFLLVLKTKVGSRNLSVVIEKQNWLKVWLDTEGKVKTAIHLWPVHF